MLSWRLLGGVDFSKLVDEYIVSDMDDILGAVSSKPEPQAAFLIASERKGNNLNYAKTFC